MSQNSDSSVITQEVTCEGCLYDAPGQRHHMGVGGCLEISYHDHQSDREQSVVSE